MGHDEIVQRCPRCKKSLTQEFYLPSHWGDNGEYCRLCRNEYTREWRKKNHEKTKALQRKSYYKAKKKEPTLNRRRRLKRHYNLTQEQVEQMLLHQNGKCLGCKHVFQNLEYCVDHNHITGQVRGLLCGGCNSAIGHVKEKIETLYNLIDYLRYFSK